MKKKVLFSLMAMLMLSLTFVSCGDDDDDDAPSSNSSLVGTWQCIHEVWYVNGDKEEDGDVASEDTDYIKFNSDGTCSSWYGDETPVPGTWTLNGNKLTVISNMGTEESVVSISGNTLTITLEGTDEEDGVSYAYTIILTYAKQ